MSESFDRSQGTSLDSRSQRPKAMRGAMVGRDHESRIIQGCIDSAFQDQGSLLLVGGEPGIGKTTLAHDAEQRARSAGLGVAWGRFPEDRGAPTLWPWLQALRALGHDSEDVIRDRVGAAADDLWPMMALSQAAGTPAESDPELLASRRFRLFEAVTSLLRWGNEPTCVLLDDIHRSDEASLGLLRHIASIIDLQPTFVIATFRDNEVVRSHPLADLLQSVAPRPPCTVLTLGPLSAAECREHATAIGEDRPLSSDVIDEIIDRSGGNPFFLEELVRSVMTGEQTSNPPATINQVILQRADLLHDRTRSTVAALSVLGRDFDIGEAEYLLDSDESVAAMLEPALRTRLLDRFGSRVRFRHALVRDALYGALPIDLRRAYHERLATKQLAGAPSVDELTDRAHHSSVAAELGSSIDVVEPSLAAARAASAGVGHADAIRWFNRALSEHLGSNRLPVMLELAEAQLRSGDHESARKTFELVFESAREDTAASSMAMAALGVGRCVVTAGPPDKALVAMLEQAQHSLAEEDTTLHIRLLARHGVELYWRDGEAARRLSKEALQLLTPSTPARVRAEAMHARLFCLRGPGRLSERLAIGSELVDLAIDEELSDMEFRGRVWLIPELLQVPDLSAYRANIAALANLADRSGHPLHLWYAYLYRAQQAITIGSHETALDLAATAVEHGRRAGAQVAPVYHIGQQYLIKRDRGGLEGIIEELGELAAKFRVFPTLRALMSLLYTDIGRNEEAAAELTRLAYQRFSAVPHDSLWIATLCICAEVSFRTRTPATGALIASLLNPHAGTCAVQGLPTCFGAVDRYIGLALSAAGRLERARAHLQRAVALHREWGFLPYELRSELDLTRNELSGAGSPAQEKAHLSRIESIEKRARESGLERLANEAHGLHQEVEKRQPARLSGPGGELSQRESEVLALVAEGVTNQELAAKLTISINTVERHLRNIYTKLGVANRAEAAAAQARHTGT